MKALTHSLFTAIFCCLFLSACDSKPDTLVEVYDEDEMDAAIEKAQANVDKFIAVMKAGNGEGFCVKAPITDENGTEHFWIVDITYEKGEFTGEVGNDPGIVKNVKAGDTWTIAKDEISDFLFSRDDKMYGNYTMRAMFSTMPPDEAAQWQSMMAEEDAF